MQPQICSPMMSNSKSSLHVMPGSVKSSAGGGDVSNKIVTAAPPPDHIKGRSPAQKSDESSMVGCYDDASKPSMSPEDAVKAMNDGFC